MIQFLKEEAVNKNIERLNKITKIISLIRLILALNLILWVICLLSLQEYILYGVLSVISFILMLVFVFITNKFFKELNLNKKKAFVYLTHYKRRKLDFSNLKDEGRDYIDKEDYKLADLDIFGSKSLFQYLNVTKTKLGRDSLANQLKNPVEKPKKFTKCIFELSKCEDTLDIEAGLLEFDESAKHINYEEFNSVLTKKIEMKTLFIFPFLCFIATIVYLILVIMNQAPLYGIIPFILGNYILSRVCLKNDIFELDAFKYYNLCDAYDSLVIRANTLNLKDEYYQELLNKMNKNISNLKRMKGIYLSLSSRKNFIANFLFNALFLYDLWLIFIYNHLMKNISTLDELFIAIAEIEVMTSFSILGMDNEIASIPNESKGSIYGKGLYHPLVKECIKNDFILEGGIVLTGSNMSGKTTFMRTLGINQVLYNAGSIVLASELYSTNLLVLTSLRANDMLSEGISTFYAEILRMKLMNERIKENKCLILVDEIFKGTNAYERIEASFKVIDKFNDYQQLFIISTHDFELCDAKNIKNYHFNEEYTGDKISFDYKIKEGKCSSTNALYLLKMSGII